MDYADYSGLPLCKDEPVVKNEVVHSGSLLSLCVSRLLFPIFELSQIRQFFENIELVPWFYRFFLSSRKMLSWSFKVV